MHSEQGLKKYNSYNAYSYLVLPYFNPYSPTPVKNTVFFQLFLSVFIVLTTTAMLTCFPFSLAYAAKKVCIIFPSCAHFCLFHRVLYIKLHKLWYYIKIYLIHIINIVSFGKFYFIFVVVGDMRINSAHNQFPSQF